MYSYIRTSAPKIIKTTTLLFLCLLMLIPGSLPSHAQAGFGERGLLFYSYIKKVRDLINDNFYKKVSDEKLVKSAFDHMRGVFPSMIPPEDYRWDTFKEYYISISLDKPEMAGKLGEAAIEGFMDSLDDPYSVLLTAEKKKALKSGDGSGIGVELGVDDGKIVIIAPLVGSPAEEAGVRAGDVLLEINGVSVKDMDLYEASSLVSGTRGKKIDLKVRRFSEIFTLSPVFRPLKIDPIRYAILSGNIGYIKVGVFNGKIYDEFVYVLNVMKSKKVNGLILDLRNNPGGDLEEALRLTAQFVPSGVLVWTAKKGGEPKAQKSGSGQSFPAPVVVLTNEGTASASEVMAAALSENEKATLIGRKTFGKGVIQTVYQLTGGAELYLTTEKYLTPKKNDINGKGIRPFSYVHSDEQSNDPTQDPFVIEGWTFLNK